MNSFRTLTWVLIFFIELSLASCTTAETIKGIKVIDSNPMNRAEPEQSFVHAGARRCLLS